jgi:hypothetical protein
MSGLIALLTDFGLKDPFVGVMKGVIYGIAPDIRVIDITHSINPQDIKSAAWVLATSYSYFPENTIFVCVVDPGVGGIRDIVLVKTCMHYFLAPDNGILSYILKNDTIDEVIKLDNKDFWLDNISNTFHGRDIFAPVAAFLSQKNYDVNIFGSKKPQEELVKLDLKSPEYLKNSITGSVVYIDNFGNLITDIPGSWIADNKILTTINDVKIKGLKNAYGAVESGELLILIGSHNCIEISARNDSAAAFLKVETGQKVRIDLLDDF